MSVVEVVDDLDSWEDIDDSELEERLKQEKIKRDEMETTQNGFLVTSSNGESDFKPRILQRQPKSQNQIKILKRPDSSSSLSALSLQQQQNNSKQVKTLEQREKEYAEARMRILGSAEASNNISEQQSKQMIYNNKVSPSSSSVSLQNYSQQQQQQFQPRIPDNLIRQPEGPKLEKGFNIRR